MIGNDQSKHASNVGLYKEALIKEVYTGIDMRYYFDKGLLRYDYIVHPGADPSQIQFSLEGSERTYLNEQGELVFTTCFGEVKNADLYSYQSEDKKSVVAQFKKQGESWIIEIGNYNKNQTLIIDPLIYSTYIGGTGLSESASSVALDASGNAYITGSTYSSDYDITTGAFQTTHGGNYDVFVTKLNATGTALIYSTYIGGSSHDEGFSIALDASGNTYITGRTISTNFDITTGAFQTTNAGDRDVFVTKLNATGTALIYSTYIGGSVLDYGTSIALDASGNAYITGITSSTNYDITSGAFQTTYGGGNTDVFITKLNATGTALIYSTYIGGGGINVNDFSYSITLDASGNTYITGSTNSTNYDITTGAFQTTNAGSYDVFVTKLNATGTALMYSTYIGGSSADEGFSIALDASGNVYITGITLSTNYDITTGAFQTTNAGGNDVFVTKLNVTGTALIYSTYIGGSGADKGQSITLDASGNAYITGRTNSTNYDITSGAFQTTNAGGNDVFVSNLNTTGTALMYSTYIGGSNHDEGNSIALDASSGSAYITGWTESTNYDITSGAFQTTYAGNKDIFVTKLCVFAPLLTPALTGNTSFCDGDVLNFNGSITQGYATGYFWEIAESDAAGNPISGGYVWSQSYTGSPSGSFTFPTLPLVCDKFYKIKLAAYNECNPWSETNLVIKINCLPTVNSSNITLCTNDPNPLLTSGHGKGYTYSWTMSPSPTVVGTASNLQLPIAGQISPEGTYCVEVTQNSTGCSNTGCSTVQYDPRLNNTPYFEQNVTCVSGDNSITVSVTVSGLNGYVPQNMVNVFYLYHYNTSTSLWEYTNQAYWDFNNSTTFVFGGPTSSLGFTMIQGETYYIQMGIGSYPDNCLPTVYFIGNSINCTAKGSSPKLYKISEEELKSLDLNHDLFSQLKINIYPNPSTGNFTLSFNQKVENGTVQVLDYTGKIILEKNIAESSMNIDISVVSSGLYFVKVVSANGISMEKLIKN